MYSHLQRKGKHIQTALLPAAASLKDAELQAK